MKKKTHEFWMLKALELAERGRMGTSPNPMVGALIVRHGKIVGKGYHERYGGDHAEIAALNDAGRRARDAILYVTLEPCGTWGKTPPCVQAILRAGISEVVIGALDPNPQNHGKGIRLLRLQGVKVLSGVLSGEVRRQNAFFFKYVQKSLPYVTLKMAQSLDGKIATFTGSSRWISSAVSRKYVQNLRAEQDALLVGKNTLLKDNPRLIAKGHRSLQAGKPWRVVLDPHLEAACFAKVFRGRSLTFRVFSEKKWTRVRRFETPAFIGLAVPEKKGKLDLKILLRKLAALGVAKVLVEGGGETAWSLLREGLVDKLLWIVAPKIVGGRAAKTSVEGEGVQRISQAIPLRITVVRPLGEDWLFEAELN